MEKNSQRRFQAYPLFEDDEEYIAISDIKQYHFCPRIIYFSKVLGVEERLTESEEKGKEAHNDFHKKEKRRSSLFGLKSIKIIQKWTALYIKSEKLRLHGILDMLIKTDNEFIPVEFKYTKAPNRPQKGHIYQIVAYSLLVEESFHTIVKRVAIYYSKDDKILIIPLTEEMRSHVLWTLKQILKIIHEEKLPETFPPERKCKSCGYFWICKRA
ncbi:MAG: CRISPR-associated protein Cas4 [Nitrososphaerales archaeon]